MMHLGPARFPVIDLSSQDWRSLASTLDAACSDLGFFVLTGHGVSEPVVSAAYRESLTFFALPLNEKRAVGRPDERVSRGYNNFGDQRNAATFAGAGAESARAPDLQESFAIGASRYEPNLWPAGRDAFRAAFSAYYAAMEGLAARLMELFELALGLPRGLFCEKIDRHASILRAICYPEPPPEIVPGQLRAGPHTDFGTLTILRIDDAPVGLQVRDHDGAWLDVSAPADRFIVNIGDLTQSWTQGRWVSSIHRVTNPPPEAAARSRRLSLVFFHEPNPDAVVGGIVAGEYRRSKVAALRGLGASHGL